MSLQTNHYINREMSWLAFNERVLAQARNPQVPLLERLKFLAITSSNLDEFFMVRVGGLHLQRSAGVGSTDPSGMTVTEQLLAIHERTTRINQSQYACYLNDTRTGVGRRGCNAHSPGRIQCASPGGCGPHFGGRGCTSALSDGH